MYTLLNFYFPQQSSEFGYTSYLNIYCEYDLEPGIEFNFDAVGQNCESLGLEFIPYGLHHVQISPHQIHGSYEVNWRFFLKLRYCIAVSFDNGRVAFTEFVAVTWQ